MTSRLNIIEGLLQWFYFEPDKFHSYQSIEKTCKRALTTIFSPDEARYAVYNVFYPLLRWGIVEYYGDNRFRLSPTAAIYHHGKVLVCHVPTAMDDTLQSFKLPEILPGISLYKHSPVVVDSCKEYKIPLVRFELCRLLSLVPTIAKLIHLWNQEQIIDASGFFQFNASYSWIKINKQAVLPGVYKKSEKTFARKFIMLSGGECKTIPERKKQFDGFSLAVLLSRIQNACELGISYSKQLQLLTIQTHFFPVILERMLSINTLFSDYPGADVANRIYHIDSKEFALVNNVFHNAIQII
ncbi:hypothetical protein [Chitinophaga sp. GbtcB8]|uniref:hypothetical protein n=1 Tax=Chitinophaga sp. GbtcB8 TaxID=2824753 RepID=UPI001C30D699|nr:hypothetical protein [Chitinophaga sp. GbtcB8]